MCVIEKSFCQLYSLFRNTNLDHTCNLGVHVLTHTHTHTHTQEALYGSISKITSISLGRNAFNVFPIVDPAHLKHINVSHCIHTRMCIDMYTHTNG